MSKLLKGAAWVTVPKLTFAAKNPKKAAFLKAAGWAADHTLNRVGRRRKRSWHQRPAIRGLGAAAVALPMGWWAGRKVWGGRTEEPTSTADAGTR